jgi:hypothetical protein
MRLKLNKAQKAKEKRARRRREWERMYQEKARIDKDAPEEVSRIEHAIKSIGYRQVGLLTLQPDSFIAKADRGQGSE